jgi:hypothetical protein
MPFIEGIFPRLFKASAFINIMLYPKKKKHIKDGIIFTPTKGH